jgi:hypothetical protein
MKRTLQTYLSDSFASAAFVVVYIKLSTYTERTSVYTNLYEQVLKGDNTDWLGIQRPVKARLGAEGRPTRGGTALIVGAGGAAMGGMYAMQQLGMKVCTLL